MNVREMLKIARMLVWGDSSISNTEVDEALGNVNCSDSNGQQAIYPEEKSDSIYNQTVVSDRFDSEESKIAECKLNSEDFVSDIPLSAQHEEGREIDVSLEQKNDKNSDFDILLSNIINLIDELDCVSNRLNSEESKNLIDFIQERMLECVSFGNMDFINIDSEFDNSRHTAVPFKIVPNGTPILKFIRKGLFYNGRVLLKAKVEV
jgi:molecular chaperone GrpE (heat shock protein)